MSKTTTIVLSVLVIALVLFNFKKTNKQLYADTGVVGPRN